MRTYAYCSVVVSIQARYSRRHHRSYLDIFLDRGTTLANHWSIISAVLEFYATEPYSMLNLIFAACGKQSDDGTLWLKVQKGSSGIYFSEQRRRQGISQLTPAPLHFAFTELYKKNGFPVVFLTSLQLCSSPYQPSDSANKEEFSSDARSCSSQHTQSHLPRAINHFLLSNFNDLTSSFLVLDLASVALKWLSHLLGRCVDRYQCAVLCYRWPFNCFDP